MLVLPTFAWTNSLSGNAGEPSVRAFSHGLDDQALVLVRATPCAQSDDFHLRRWRIPDMELGRQTLRPSPSGGDTCGETWSSA
jgi:hypothetical protein